MFTSGTVIGLFAFVVVMLAAAYLIQRLDSAIAPEDEAAVTDSTHAPASDQSAPGAHKRVDGSTKHRRHGR